MKPGFFTNEELADCGVHAHLLFGGLWTLADRSGRLEDRSRRIKIQIMPFYECDIDACLSSLSERGFIIRYEANGNKYIQINNFEKHQNPHVKEIDSTIPAPDLPGAGMGNTGTSPADSLLPLTDSLNPIPVLAQAPPVAGLENTAWQRWMEYRKQIRKPLKPASILAAQETLAAFGSDQQAVVQQSIANGYQGLFALKTNGGTNATRQPVDNSAVGKVRRANEERERRAESQRKTDGPGVATDGVDVRPPLDQ